MTTLKEIERALPSLPKSDLKKLQQRIKLLLGGESAPPTAVTSKRAPAASSPVDDWVLLGIANELKRRGVLTKRGGLPAGLVSDKFRALSAELREDLESDFQPPLHPTERAALGNLLAEALARLLERDNIPVKPQPMLTNVGRMVEALEDAFPGYRGAGMLRLAWGGHGQRRQT